MIILRCDRKEIPNTISYPFSHVFELVQQDFHACLCEEILILLATALKRKENKLRITAGLILFLLN